MNMQEIANNLVARRADEYFTRAHKCAGGALLFIGPVA